MSESVNEFDDNSDESSIDNEITNILNDLEKSSLSIRQRPKKRGRADDSNDSESDSDSVSSSDEDEADNVKSTLRYMGSEKEEHFSNEPKDISSRVDSQGIEELLELDNEITEILQQLSVKEPQQSIKRDLISEFYVSKLEYQSLQKKYLAISSELTVKVDNNIQIYQAYYRLALRYRKIKMSLSDCQKSLEKKQAEDVEVDKRVQDLTSKVQVLEEKNAELSQKLKNNEQLVTRLQSNNERLLKEVNNVEILENSAKVSQNEIIALTNKLNQQTDLVHQKQNAIDELNLTNQDLHEQLNQETMLRQDRERQLMSEINNLKEMLQNSNGFSNEVEVVPQNNKHLYSFSSKIAHNKNLSLSSSSRSSSLMSRTNLNGTTHTEDRIKNSETQQTGFFDSEEFNKMANTVQTPITFSGQNNKRNMFDDFSDGTNLMKSPIPEDFDDSDQEDNVDMIDMVERNNFIQNQTVQMDNNLDPTMLPTNEIQVSNMVNSMSSRSLRSFKKSTSARNFNNNNKVHNKSNSEVLARNDYFMKMNASAGTDREAQDNGGLYDHYSIQEGSPRWVSKPRIDIKAKFLENRKDSALETPTRRTHAKSMSSNFMHAKSLSGNIGADYKAPIYRKKFNSIQNITRYT